MSIGSTAATDPRGPVYLVSVLVGTFILKKREVPDLMVVLVFKKISRENKKVMHNFYGCEYF